MTVYINIPLEWYLTLLELLELPFMQRQPDTNDIATLAIFGILIGFRFPELRRRSDSASSISFLQGYRGGYRFFIWNGTFMHFFFQLSSLWHLGL